MLLNSTYRWKQTALLGRFRCKGITCWELCTAMAVVTSPNSTKHVMERAPRTSFNCRNPAQADPGLTPCLCSQDLPLPHECPDGLWQRSAQALAWYQHLQLR